MIHILNQDDEIIDYFDINDGTVLEPDLIRNIETLEDTLEFSVATKRSINVQDRNRVIIKDNEGEYREFIIMQYESNLDGFTDVSCVGSHLEDFQTAKPFKPQKLERYTTKEALNFMSADTGWEVAPDNEWNGTRTTSWTSWKDRLSLIKQLQTTYDMRLSFYVELGTNTVKHRYVKLVEVNPMFNGEEIVYGENMIDLKRTVDFTDVATALIAIGPEDDDGNRLIIEEVDNEAQNQLGLPYRYLWQIYEPESDDQNMTEARLRTLARTKLNKIKAASVEYTIQSTQLNVKNGDMIRVKNEDFTPELYVEAEVIEIRYNAYTKLCDYKFGILTEYTRAEVYERFNALLETLRERLNNIKYDTENVINERLEVELAGLERYIEKSPFPPLDPQEGDLWLDTSHDQVAVLKRFENGKWVKSSVTEAHEVNAPTKEEALYTMLQERKNRLNNDFISNYGLFNTLTAHKYYDELDADIRNMLFDLFVDQTNKYSAFEADFDYINAEQPTIGLILAAMESALRFEDSSNQFKTGYNTARAALDAYLEILRSQYTDEKYLDALNAVADKFGLDVVDGKLMGDANFIENMEEIKVDLQQQLDAAKAELENFEVGGRNWFAKSKVVLSNNLRYDDQLDLYYNVGTSRSFSIFRMDSLGLELNKKYILAYEIKSNIPELELRTNTYINGSVSSVENNSPELIEGEWVKVYTEPFLYHTETTASVHIYFNQDLESSRDIEIRNIQINRGTILQDYQEAPEDTDNKITKINQSITNIEGQLKSTVNKDTFDLLKGTVTQQGTTIQQTADSLSSKADKSVVDTLSGTVKNHGTQITQTAEEIASKADKTLLDAANNTITQQGTLINQNAQEIALRAKTADLNSVTGRVTKAEADIKINAGEISSRVKDVDYQTDKEGIIGRLSGAESSITQQSNLIETKVSSTELTQAIDDINIGGVNLANWTETSVENKNRYRPTGKTNDVNIVTLQGEKFTQVRELNGESGVGSVFGIYVGRWNNTDNNSYFNIEKDQEYTLTLRGQNSSTTEEFSYVFIMRDDNLENPESTTSGTNQGVSSAIVDRVNVESGYGSRYKFSFKANWNSKKAYILVGTHKKSGYGAGTSFWFRFKELQLEKGNKATDWSLSQTDTLKQFKDLDDRITTHDTQIEQTDKQIALRAKMTDVNKSDKTLSQALSELIIDSSNGLKFSYDSNGRLASYSVGRDGIQFDGSKIKFTASDSIMLQISDAKKAGTDAQGIASDAKSKIDNLDLSGTNLVSGTNFAIQENVDRLDTPWGSAKYTSESEYLLVLNSNLAENATFGLRTFKDDFKLKQGAEYTLSFEAYSNVNADSDFSYVYLYRYGASDQGSFTMDKELIGTAGGSTGIGYDLYRYTCTFKNTTGTEPANLLIATRGTGYSWFRIKNVMLTRGNVAVPYNVQGHKMVDTDSLIPTINGDKNGWTISGKKIDLVGDVNMVNGQVKVRNLTASSGTNKLELTGSGLVMDGSVGNLSMGSSGIVYKDKSGVIKYEMNENFVRSSTFGTTTANIYLAASKDYEVRFADIADIPGGGAVNDYTYIDTRAKVMYAEGVANNPRHSSHLNLGADGEVRIMNNGRTTYGAARAAAVYAHSYNWSTADNNSNNLYVRPSSAGEVRFTAVGTTTNYSDIRAAKVYSDSVWSHRFADYWIRVDGEAILSAHGSTTNYRDIRGMFAHFDALDVNTGSHIYTRVHGASAELRVTARGTTDKYRDIRFRNWTAVSSEKYKTDITEWNYNVLDIIKDEIKIYQYKYKDDVAEGDNIMYQRGLVLERETPSEFIKGDGINQYEMATWTLKGVQELAQRDDEKDKIIKEQGDKIEELEKQMSEVMQLLNNK